VLGSLRDDGTAEIVAYLPTSEPADDLYFVRLQGHITQSGVEGAQLRVYPEGSKVDSRSNQIVHLGFTVVGQASICRFSASRSPHFQVIGEMVAPLAEARKAWKDYVELLNQWLKPPEEHASS
jgi:hypothetical protein